MSVQKKIIIAITGASGAIYAYYLLQSLAKLHEYVAECCIVFSDNGQSVWEYELKKTHQLEYGKHIRYADNHNLFDAISSGSSGYDTMIIVPCSMGTLGRLSAGMANDLITRAADVMLKERKTLLIVPRESPYNTIHLQNMLTLSQFGAMIIPASPFFYHQPESLDQLILPFTERILSYAGLPSNHFNWANQSK